MANSIMVTDLVEKVGCRHLCPVSELKSGRKIDERIREVPILYRWWFPEKSLIMDYLRDYVNSHAEDYKMKYLLEHGLRKIKIGDTEYCALYFGKSDTGRTRFKNHVKGAEDDSTLRKTIRAILTLMNDKDCDNVKRIDDILSECYYEWTEFLDQDGLLIDSFEVMAISLGYYPLNLEDNPSVSSNLDGDFSVSEDNWVRKIMEQRKNLKEIPIIK